MPLLFVKQDPRHTKGASCACARHPSRPPGLFDCYCRDTFAWRVATAKHGVVVRFAHQHGVVKRAYDLMQVIESRHRDAGMTSETMTQLTLMA